MKPGENSQAPLRDPASHRFPDLADRGHRVCNKAGAADRDQFKPLFHEATAANVPPALEDGTADDNTLMEQTRQRGYANGFEAGRQEACQMVDHLLAPHVDDFRQAVERLVSYQQCIADQASTHMIKLAVAIAERIMGTDVRVSEVDLQQLRPALIEAICKRYELHLRYHPEDLANLHRLMACKGAHRWRTDSGLCIENDRNIAQGTLIDGREAGQHPSIAEQVQPSLQQVLINAEPDRTP